MRTHVVWGIKIKKIGARETKRIARLYKDRQLIANLRKHFTGYDPKDGYFLTPAKIKVLPYSQKRGLRAKHAKLQTLLSKPFIDFVKPVDSIARAALRKFTGERMRNMKHFIVQKPSAESKVRVVEGNVQLRTQFSGDVAFTERFYMFPRMARGHSDMIRMFNKLYLKMPPGMYVLQTDSYGDTGGIVERELLLDELQRMLEVYDQSKYGEDRFMYRIAGFRWMSTKLHGAEIQIRKRDEARERQRQYNLKKREELHTEIMTARAKIRKRKKK